MDYAEEQALHNDINLRRLVRRLEKSTSDHVWDEPPRHDTWIKALGTLQSVKYARKLLKDVEMYDMDITPMHTHRYDDMRSQLNRVEDFMQGVEKRVKPPLPERKPLLPSLPIHAPPPTDPPSNAPRSPKGHSPSEILLAADGPTPHTPSLASADNLLLSPSDIHAFVSPIPTLIPPTLPASAKPTKSTISATTGVSTSTPGSSATPRALQNSNALQQELSEQLAHMASQLKRNALHFADSLEKDRAVVEGTQEKIESNFDVMHKERVRVRDLRSTTRGTTCLVMTAVLLVTLLFMLMVSLIRFT